MRFGGALKHYQQEFTKADGAMRERPFCNTCGKYHLRCCLFGTRADFKCKQEGHTTDRCLSGFMVIRAQVLPNVMGTDRNEESLPLIDKRSREQA
ncbi:gag protease polyprotein [Cucumis melo var. makuwa]|uniref:Gag protease polyprotein n=1 Tax=Cucumis melo var. makuwa TaxID=1194695 RepID=A0A5A7TBM2_CUCMM|nr:gag protease polyprotein [Cucumis melo var. makuwa]TYK23486.1 gag protease polyprotein [Cucumis melo var. makuwa]